MLNRNKIKKLIPFLIVQNKDGKPQRLIPWEEQEKIIDAILSGEKVVIIKPRQIGSSTITIACLFWEWLLSPDPIQICIISYKAASAKHLMNIWRGFLDNLPEEMKPKLSQQTQSEMVIAGTGARVFCQSAGGKESIRSFSAQRVLLSEFSYAPDPVALKAAVVAAANQGQIIIESTPRAPGDALWEEIEIIKKGGEGKLLFFPWWGHKAYSKKNVTWEDLGELSDEEIKWKNHKLSPEQIAWGREKSLQVGELSFRREFPFSIKEAYESIEGLVFPHSFLERVHIAKRGQAVDRRKNYVIGVDPSAGVGRDHAVACCIDLKERRVVDWWSDNNSPIWKQAQVVIEMAAKWNGAWINCETNGLGVALLQEIQKGGYHKIFRQKGRAWTTTQKNKREIFYNIQREFKLSDWHIPQELWDELPSWQWDENENPEWAGINGHGDHTIAFGLALAAANKVVSWKRGQPFVDLFPKNKNIYKR